MNVSPGLAFLAGLASFLSPCVFAIIPGFVSYLGSRSLAGMSTTTGSYPFRWELIGHGLLFFVGFSVVFIFPRVMVSELGGTLYMLRDWLSKIGGLIIIVVGLQFAGILKLPFHNNESEPVSNSKRWPGYVSSGLIGAFFSAGWSPCVGPTLGGILTLGMAGSSTGQSVELLTFYSTGLALPFLLLAGGVGGLIGFLTRYSRASLILKWGVSAVLIIMGGMLLMGIIEQTAQFGYFINFGL
jgi:cytochrome c-type biogenesis protein